MGEQGGAPPLPAEAPPPLPDGPAPPLPPGEAPPLPPGDDTPMQDASAPATAGGGGSGGAGPSSSWQPALPDGAAAAAGSSRAGTEAAAAAGGGGASSSKQAQQQEQDEAAASRSAAEEEALLKEFFGEMRDVDRDNEVNRILWAFKLNPYERLALRFTVTPEEVRKQFRKLSLMVHPDKCKHPQASEAFDILGAAQKELLDEARRADIWQVLELARDEVRKERDKETKHDTTIELAALLHEKGKEGVREQYEQSDEFHEKWRVKARDMLARSEWRRRRLTKRLKDETARAKEEHEELRQTAKKQKEHEKAWESSRDTRVGTWREYMKKGGQGSKKGPAGAAHLKPPKQKTHDEDKLYVQRPAGPEQHRPPPPKPAGPKKAGY